MSDNNKKFDPRYRSSLRGLKKCGVCGTYNGQRAALCRNESCENRKLALRHPFDFDPIRIVDRSCASNGSLYSLQSNERNAHLRSFVRLQNAGVGAASVCFVENCRTTAGCCKHIGACNVNTTASKTSQAEVYSVSREVMWNLNIEIEQKQRLWNICKTNEQVVPAVQRLNGSTFVVRCTQSKVFPAGLLHVTALSDGLLTKKSTYSCACKKLKIILEPDNSVVMQDDVCDHILLVLAAILSKQNGKFAYSNFTNALKSFWMPEALETPVAGNDIVPDNFFGLSINNIGDEFVSDSIPDFPSSPTGITQNITQLFSVDGKKDISLASSSAITTIAALDAENLDAETHLELSDCNIELMDQFELTDHIDLSSDDILKLSNPPAEFTNAISILSPSITFDQLQSLDSCTSIETPTKLGLINPASLLKCNQSNVPLHEEINAATLPTIELPTIAVVKKCPVKTSALVNEVKTRKFPHIPAKRTLIVNSNEALNGTTASEHDEPKLAYSAWLDYVIETINQSIYITEQTNITHNFHVHEEIFAHFSKTFSAGIKWRLPNTTSVIKHGHHRGLIKYTWYFTTSSIIQRIFTTKNLTIELTRSFECQNGSYVPYNRPSLESQSVNQKEKRRIYPKIELHTAHVWFDCNTNEAQNTGLKIDWLPKAFPKSHFGILTIQFSLDIKHPSLNAQHQNSE